MCTPVGHSLFGVFLWSVFILPARQSLNYLWRWSRGQWDGLVLAVLMANLCDLDYLPGLLTGDLNAWHYTFTHSIGWVVLAGAGTSLIWKGLQPAVSGRTIVLIFAALASHLLLDWFTASGNTHRGLMAGWPFSLQRTTSPVSIFPRVAKDTLGDLWQWRNLVPVLVDLAVMGTLLAMALFFKTRRPKAV